MKKSLSCWVFLIAFYGKFANPTELKLGFVYDPSGPFANAFLGYKFYANKINSMGGLVVGQPNSSTTYQIKIVEHSNSDITDPYWQTSGSRKLHIEIAKLPSWMIKSLCRISLFTMRQWNSLQSSAVEYLLNFCSFQMDLSTTIVYHDANNISR